MTLVSTVTVGSGGAASIEFTGISASGKDLLILLSPRKTGSGIGGGYVVFNSDTGSNYSTRYLRGSGAAASSATSSATGLYIDRAIPGTDYTASTFGNIAVYVSNYTSSSAKSASLDSVSENNAVTSYQTIAAARWTGTSAITSITLNISAGNYAQDTTASLYIIS